MRNIRRPGWLLLAVLLSGCSESPSMMAPHAFAAAQINWLWWIMLAISTAVIVLVTALLLGALFRPRSGDVPRREGGGVSWVVLGGILLPVVVLSGLVYLTLQSMAALRAEANNALTIEVIGHDWWWEFRYPDQHFVTANEMHIPAGQPVRLRLATNDVIHSFWVPQLNGKRDLIPGQTNELQIQADTPGAYRGQCAEYCGTQHARMELLVVADSPADWQTWVQHQQQPAVVTNDPLVRQGAQVFGEQCAYCHAMNGTEWDTNVGPNLTHVASRQTLAAGALPNSAQYLRDWIVSPQRYKPGNHMPTLGISGSSLQAVIAYLEAQH